MASALENVLTRDVMLELAGESYFERGEDYHHDGHVHDLMEHEGVVVARVAGTEDYRMRLWAEDDLAFSCDCPLGLDGEFCKHCVAAGLAWLEGDSLENAQGGSATMHDVQTYLEKQDREVLVRIVMQQAMEDERLRERLLLRASRAEPGGAGETTLRVGAGRRLRYVFRRTEHLRRRARKQRTRRV
jgi:uncharacterized Zn finger protein